jgi:hypothetical protein
MKIARKHENNEFLVMSLKHELSFMGRANRPRTPKLWAIAHENVHKTRKRQVFGHNSQIYIVSLQTMQITLEPENYGQ